jgi:hypothetical protein
MPSRPAPLHCRVDVSLRGGDAIVPQHLHDGEGVGTRLPPPCSEGVPQAMKGELLWGLDHGAHQFLRVRDLGPAGVLIGPGVFCEHETRMC